MRSQNSPYLPGVDHLRAFASLLIVLYHSQQIPINRLDPGGWIDAENWLHAVVVEGHTAVSLFFVLSGFIFTRAALGREVAYGAFLRNRLLRIYPLFLFLLALGAAAFPAVFRLIPTLQSVLGLSNYRGAQDFGPITWMFWTIGIEMQFYLLFPLLLKIANRRGMSALVWLCVGVIVLRALSVALGGDLHGLTYWTIVGRLEQFVAGMIVAIGLDRLSPSGRERWRWAIAPLALVIPAALALFNASGGFPAEQSWRFAWPTVEAALWALFVASWLGLAPRIPRIASRVIARVGEISYSTYLMHVIVVHLAFTEGLYLRTGAGPYANLLLNGLFVIFPIVLVLASLTYSTIERPFLGLRGRYLIDATGEEDGSGSDPGIVQLL